MRSDMVIRDSHVVGCDRHKLWTPSTFIHANRRILVQSDVLNSAGKFGALLSPPTPAAYPDCRNYPTRSRHLSGYGHQEAWPIVWVCPIFWMRRLLCRKYHERARDHDARNMPRMRQRDVVHAGGGSRIGRTLAGSVDPASQQLPQSGVGCGFVGT